MDVLLLVKALGIGVAVAAPVGPMSLMCIQRTLDRGQVAGMAFGAGVAGADGTYAAIAAFGIAALTAALLAAAPWIEIGGSILLIVLGARIAAAQPASKVHDDAPSSGWRAFATAYALTMANPPTVLFFAAVFASMAWPSSAAAAALFCLGVFTGSLLWWLVLTTLVRNAASRLGASAMLWINRCSGAALAAFGCHGLFAVL